MLYSRLTFRPLWLLWIDIIIYPLTITTFSSKSKWKFLEMPLFEVIAYNLVIDTNISASNLTWRWAYCNKSYGHAVTIKMHFLHTSGSSKTRENTFLWPLNVVVPHMWCIWRKILILFWSSKSLKLQNVARSHMQLSIF